MVSSPVTDTHTADPSPLFISVYILAAYCEAINFPSTNAFPLHSLGDDRRLMSPSTSDSIQEGSGKATQGMPLITEAQA